MNKLYFGDNFEILCEMDSERVDLICTDPPFNSGRNYNAFLKDSKAQNKAFTDIWTWDTEAKKSRAYIENPEHSKGIIDAIWDQGNRKKNEYLMSIFGMRLCGVIEVQAILKKILEEGVILSLNIVAVNNGSLTWMMLEKNMLKLQKRGLNTTLGIKGNREILEYKN